MSSRKQRIVFGLTATIVGLAMFMVASSFIVSRGLPHWLAAAVGAFAFPVAPLAWQVVGERRRARRVAAAKTPTKASLTGIDRYWLRVLAVALLVLGPMVAIGKFGVVRAVFKHGLWFWPASYEPTTTHGGPLATIGTGAQRAIDVMGGPLQRVPADAELVVFVQPPPEQQADGRGVLAWGDRQLLVAAEGKELLADNPAEKLAELNKQRNKLPWFPIDEVVEVKRSDSQYVAASQGWRYRVEPPGTGPGAEIVRELGRSPKPALIVGAYVPKTMGEIRAAAGWIVNRGDKLLVEGRLEARDEAAAKKLVAEAQTVLSTAAKDVPERCREGVGKIVRAVQLDQTGAVITGRFEADPVELMGLAFCAFKD